MKWNDPPSRAHRLKAVSAAARWVRWRIERRGRFANVFLDQITRVSPDSNPLPAIDLNLFPSLWTDQGHSHHPSTLFEGKTSLQLTDTGLTPETYFQPRLLGDQLPQ